MRNLISLKVKYIRTQHPNIEDIMTESSPKCEILVKNWIDFKWNFGSLQNNPHKNDDGNKSSSQNSNEKWFVMSVKLDISC